MLYVVRLRQQIAQGQETATYAKRVVFLPMFF